MAEHQAEHMTKLLASASSGDDQAQAELLGLAYNELRAMASHLMHGERAGHTLQPTALVHEAILRFFKNDDMSPVPNRAYFYGAMARAMRQILVDHARKHRAVKRGGQQARVPLDETVHCFEQESGFDVLELDEILDRLEALDQRTCQVVMLKCFAGLEHKQIAEQLQVSLSTVDREWRFAKAWLRNEMEK